MNTPSVTEPSAPVPIISQAEAAVINVPMVSINEESHKQNTDEAIDKSLSDEELLKDVEDSDGMA